MQQPFPDKPLLLTINQVIELLQLKRNKIYDLIRKEGLPVQHFGRAVRIRPEALKQWLDERSQKEMP
jgi:excisionase family DNA binding protein